MKLFIYELRKLSNSRFVIGCIAALLLLNIIICTYTIKNTNPLPEEVVRDIYSSYILDANSVDSIHAAWETDYLEYERQYQSYIKRGGIEPCSPGNYWLPNGMSDAKLYDKLYADVNRLQTFRNSIAETVKAAMASKVSLENNQKKQSYEYLYQEEIIRRYTSLHDQVYIGFENTRGYDVYLECRVPLFLSIIAGSIVASYYYTIERTSASLALIRCTKKGRIKLTGSKITAAFITTYTFFIVSQLTAFTIVGSRIGFSSMYNSIQAFEDFTYCPFNMTVLQCCIFDLLLKSFCLLFLVSVFILVSSKTDYLTACAINISICASVIVMYYVTQRASGSFVHLINPLSLAFDSLLRYRAVNLLGMPYHSIFVVSGLLGILLLLCTIVSCFCFTYSYSAKKTISLAQRIRSSKFHITFQENKYNPSLSLFKHELYKIGSSRAIIVSAFVFVVLTAFIVPSEVGEQSTDEYKLQDYIQSSLYGNITDEKISYINAEGVRLSNAYIQYDKNVDDYYQGQLSLEQFKPIADERAYADSRKNAYGKLKTYSEYLSSQDKEKDIWFIYETGWSTLFSDHDMIVIVTIICFISSIIVGLEYVSSTSSGGFHQILRTTHGGRSLTYKNKAVIIFGIIFLLHGFYYVLQLILINIVFSLDGLEAPLKSLSMFQNHFLKDQTIVFFLFFHYLYQLTVSVSLGFLVMGMSYIFRNGFIAFVSIITCCLLPTLTEYLGINIPNYFSISSLMNLTNLNMPPVAICIILLSMVTIITTIYSYRKFT